MFSAESVARWLSHPKFELIYLLGGIPREHIDTLHYRNIEKVVADLSNKFKEANK